MTILLSFAVASLVVGGSLPGRQIASGTKSELHWPLKVNFLARNNTWSGLRAT